MTSVPPTDPSPTDPSEGAPYKSQFHVSPQFKKFWETLFHHTELTDKQVSQMTDQFIRQVWDNMSQVLNWALQQQKKRDEDEKKGD